MVDVEKEDKDEELTMIEELMDAREDEINLKCDACLTEFTDPAYQVGDECPECLNGFLILSFLDL